MAADRTEWQQRRAYMQLDGRWTARGMEPMEVDDDEFNDATRCSRQVLYSEPSKIQRRQTTRIGHPLWDTTGLAAWRPA